MTLVVLAGPPACGKTHTARALLARRAQYVLAKGAVTRPSRGADDNNDVLISPQDYLRYAEQLCLRREINGHRYGYFTRWIDDHLATSHHVLLPLMAAADVKEAANIWPSVRTVYLRPTTALLESRLRTRHAASADQVADRLAQAIGVVSELDRQAWGLTIEITADHRPIAALVDDFVVGPVR